MYTQKNFPHAVITGACSYVGRHLCKGLHDSGYCVVAIDNMSSSNSVHPDDWPADININHHCDFLFFHMGCDEFFMDDVPYFNENTNWDMAVHLAKTANVEEQRRIDADFCNWIVRHKVRNTIILHI